MNAELRCGAQPTHPPTPSRLQADKVPAVTVSLSLDVLSSTQLRLWISKRLARPSLGFHSDCRRRGFSLSPTTLNPSVLH